MSYANMTHSSHDIVMHPANFHTSHSVMLVLFACLLTSVFFFFTQHSPFFVYFIVAGSYELDWILLLESNVSLLKYRKIKQIQLYLHQFHDVHTFYILCKSTRVYKVLFCQKFCQSNNVSEKLLRTMKF